MINTIDNIELARRDEQRSKKWSQSVKKIIKSIFKHHLTVEARYQSQVTSHWSSLDTCRDLLSLALTDCDTVTHIKHIRELDPCLCRRGERFY